MRVRKREHRKEREGHPAIDAAATMDRAVKATAKKSPAKKIVPAKKASADEEGGPGATKVAATAKPADPVAMKAAPTEPF